jgi:hypothetical protein
MQSTWYQPTEPMADVSIDDLRTPANGQVFALKKVLSQTAVQSVFHAASKHATGRLLGKVFREMRNIDGTEYWASLVCFRLTRQPPFLPETSLEEQTYGFLLLLDLQVNTEWYLGIFKHGTASIADWLDERAKPLPRSQFTNAFSDGTTIQKINVQRMSASKYELRAASYEADDVPASLPVLTAGRCVIRAIRFQGAATGSIGVTVSTSRIQRSGGRCEVGDLAALVKLVASETQANRRNDFLSGFAQTVAIDDLPPGTHPTSVLFDWGEINENDSFELYRKPGPGEELQKTVPKLLLSRVLGDTLEATPNGPDWDFGKGRLRPRGTLRRTNSSFRIKSLLGNQIVVRNSTTEETVSLARWVNENDAYTVTFTQPEFVFAGGALYLRADFDREVDAVRRCLKGERLLGRAASEKGSPKKADTRFSADSIFGIAEDSIYRRSEWLCCIDLGNEWADYLCIKDSALVFIHCKNGKPTTGATSFHEVVAQALKNLGRVQSTPEPFNRRLAATRRTRFWAKTKSRGCEPPGPYGRTFYLPSTIFLGIQTLLGRCTSLSRCFPWRISRNRRQIQSRISFSSFGSSHLSQTVAVRWAPDRSSSAPLESSRANHALLGERSVSIVVSRRSKRQGILSEKRRQREITRVSGQRDPENDAVDRTTMLVIVVKSAVQHTSLG